MLGVETITFECFTITSFGMKPKDHRERGEPLTGDDMFIKAV